MDQPKIVVAVRKRPLSKKEQQQQQNDIIEVAGSSVTVREPRLKVDLTKYVEEFTFNFDAAFSEYTTNEQLYASLVQPLVQAALQGSKVTCFAYGQTGSGKTYTMLGDQNVRGIYTLAAQDIFLTQQSVSVSFYEIYCSKLFDLLNERALLHPREDAKGQVNIAGLLEVPIQSVAQLLKTIELGISSRVTAQNSVNSDSSRSHAILQIQLKVGSKAAGKLSFIDLAGSERGADVVEYHKQTRIDGAEINKSLLALKECIRALDLNKNHTPFRGSKLTLVLKDSFMGNCRTLMIGTISPCHKDAEHTLNTLRYADRVKELKQPNDKPSNNWDYLARELMLPRQQVPSNQLFEPPYMHPPLPQPHGSSSKNHQNSNNHPNHRMSSPPQMPRSSVSPPTLFHQGLVQQQDEEDETLEEDQLRDKHEELIQQILKDEETLILSHRTHIDEIVELVKQEMYLLHNVDKPGSDVEEYVDGLDQILLAKIDKIQKLRKKLQYFKQKLMEEQDMAHQCQTHFYQHH